MRIATFDLETTGFEPESCDIIEVGIVIHEGQEEVESYGSLVNVGYKIPSKIEKLTGIHSSDLRESGQPWERVARKASDHLNQADAWCAYNADFDVGFITHHIDNLNPPDIIDPLEMAYRFLPDDEVPDRKLGTICKRYGVNLQQAHRAIHDARATADVLFEFIDRFNFHLNDWINGDPVCLGRHHHGEDPFEALYSSRRSHYA